MDKKDINKEAQTENKLEKMRNDLTNEEKCKIIAKKISEYIKNGK